MATKKVPVVGRLQPELVERLKNCVVALQEQGASINLIVEAGVKAELERLEKKYNRGKPFPERTAEPTNGPVKLTPEL